MLFDPENNLFDWILFKVADFIDWLVFDINIIPHRDISFEVTYPDGTKQIVGCASLELIDKEIYEWKWFHKTISKKVLTKKEVEYKWK